MTPDELAAIRARAEAATPEPWIAGHNTAVRSSGVTSQGPDYEGARIADVWSSHADAEFIAHARTDVPKLVAEVERLQAGMVEGDRCIDQAGRTIGALDRERVELIAENERVRSQRRDATEQAGKAQQEADALAEKIARVEALAVECEGQHGQCWNSIFGQRIRAALADPLAASEEQEEV